MMDKNRLDSRGRAALHAPCARAAAALWVALLVTGCQSPPPAQQFNDLLPQSAAKTEVLLLREGDSVRVSFPGAPNLNSVQQIRRDGKVTLPLVGEFKAAGLTPAQMEQELIKLYSPQLQTKEVTVALESSAYAVYVSGAVLRPGRITSDRPMTALEAIMEAGGFDYAKANLKAVAVVRRENGRTERHVINLKRVLNGQQEDPFSLRPGDIIIVPERFTWF